MQIPADVMRSFIALAQKHEPTIPAALHQYVVAKYVEKRQLQRDGREELSYMYVTPRTLLGMIRLSQSIAKFHFRDQVTQADVDRAINLMDFSLKTLGNMQKDGKSHRRGKPQGIDDVKTKVIEDIRTLFEREGVRTMNQEQIYKKLTRTNPVRYGQKAELSKDNIVDVLLDYKRLQVLYIDPEENVLFL